MESDGCPPGDAGMMFVLHHLGRQITFVKSVKRYLMQYPNSPRLVKVSAAGFGIQQQGRKLF